MSSITVEHSIKFCSSQEAMITTSKTICIVFIEANVQTKHVVYIIYYAGVNHRLSTAHAFLCRLEDQFNSTFELIFMLCHIVCKTNTHCHMCIMTTSMHRFIMTRAIATLNRCMASLFRFDNIIRVHIYTECHYRPFITELHSCYNRCFTKAQFFY